MSERATCTFVDIGNCIRRRRQELGLTQEALAERIEVTFQQVQRYEYGRNRLNVESLQRIAKALNAPVAYFFLEQKAKEESAGGDELNREEQKMVALFRGIRTKEKRALAVNVLKEFSQG